MLLNSRPKLLFQYNQIISLCCNNSQQASRQVGLPVGLSVSEHHDALMHRVNTG